MVFLDPGVQIVGDKTVITCRMGMVVDEKTQSHLNCSAWIGTLTATKCCELKRYKLGCKESLVELISSWFHSFCYITLYGSQHLGYIVFLLSSRTKMTSIHSQCLVLSPSCYLLKIGFLKLAATEVSAFCNRTFLGILPYWNKGHSDVLKT